MTSPPWLDSVKIPLLYPTLLGVPYSSLLFHIQPPQSPLPACCLPALPFAHTMTEKKPVHLVVLAHGLWGNAGHLEFIAKQLKDKYLDEIHLLNSRKNQSSFTYDGIDVCGDRLVAEILEEYDNLSKTANVTKFSILGYSLGGLFSRYAVGHLFEQGFFDKIEAANFITFASPHLGVYQPQKTAFAGLFNWMSARILSRTGEQLQLVDKFEDEKPILLIMAHPDYSYYRGLERFERRLLYVNVSADYSVPFWTGAISEVNPFSDLKSVEITHDSIYTSIIQDFKPITRAPETLAQSAKKISLYALLTVALPIIVPIWFVLVASMLTAEGLNSRRRLRSILKSRPASSASSKLSVASQQQHNSVADVIDTAVLIPTLDVLDRLESEQPARESQATLSATLSVPEGEKSAQTLKLVTAPLDLLPAQREAAQVLNRLTWTKLFVYIDDVTNAHGAIVLRSKRFKSNGGKAVVKHFTNWFKV